MCVINQHSVVSRLIYFIIEIYFRINMIGFIMIYIYFVFNFMLLLNSFLITNFANVYLIILDGS